MDAIKNDIYLSTIFNACEEKVLTYEELLQKVNLYTKKENFDEETLNHILEEVVFHQRMRLQNLIPCMLL